MTASSSLFALGEPSAAMGAGGIDHCEAVPGGLLALHGCEQDLADRIAKRHAERVAQPWRTVSLLDEHRGQLGLLVHDFEGSGGAISVSFEDSGLPLTRPALAFLADLFFVKCAAARVLVRLPLHDRERRATLARLGFVWGGLEAPIGRLAHVRLVLTPDALPARFRRWRLRRCS